MEPILTEELSRFVILPIDPRYRDLWELYKKHEALFWKAESIDYTADLKDWDNLKDEERRFIEMILAFFAGSDGIVLENLLGNFATEVKISEARAFYAFQGMIENVHSLTYAMLIDTLVKDSGRKNVLFNAISEIPVVGKKAEWAMKWMDPQTKSFGLRLVAFAVVEGVFFSGAFCSIFWLRESNRMVKGLGTSNEYIARDEGMHVEFAVALFGKLLNKPDISEVNELVREAVVLEKEFICEAISCDMIGMNTRLMSQYIEFVADRLLVQLGYSRIYKTECPFSFMENISLENKTNFFEKRVTEYQLAPAKKQLVFDDNQDF